MHIVDAFYTVRFVPVAEGTQAELERMSIAVLAAVDYFEQRQDWSAFSEALDSCAGLAFRLHNPAAYIIESSQRRLTVRQLSPFERGDAIITMGVAYFLLGDYTCCIDIIKNALINRHPDEPLIYLGSGPATAMFAAQLVGRWDDIEYIADIFKEVWEQVQEDLGLLMSTVQGNLFLLLVAAVRENRPTVDAAYTMLNRYIQRFVDRDEGELVSADMYRALILAYRDDDATHLQEFHTLPEDLKEIAGLWTVFLSEHNIMIVSSYYPIHTWQRI